MRVLFVVQPERSHFLTMVPLAWALRTAGHDVRVAGQPAFAGVITQAGLTAVPVGRDADLWQLVRRRPGSWSPPQGLTPPYDAPVRATPPTAAELTVGYTEALTGWHRRTNAPTIAGLVDFARYWRPDLVVWEPMTWAGAIAARACGAAHARLLWSIDVFGATREIFRRQPADRDPLAEWLTGYADRYGFGYDEDLVTGQFTVDLLPPSLTMRAPGLDYVPLRYTPYGGPAVVPDWLYQPPTRPRVAITLGITATDHAGGYAADVQEILVSLEDLDVDVVATVADSERHRIARVPGNARVVPYVPLHALAPTCGVVVNHAGPGTLLTTASHAVPQLTVPWLFDEPELGRRAAAQGSALTIAPADASGRAVRHAVQRLLAEPAFATRAGDLRDEVQAMPTPNDVAGGLEKLAAAHR